MKQHVLCGSHGLNPLSTVILPLAPRLRGEKSVLQCCPFPNEIGLNPSFPYYTAYDLITRFHFATKGLQWSDSGWSWTFRILRVTLIARRHNWWHVPFFFLIRLFDNCVDQILTSDFFYGKKLIRSEILVLEYSCPLNVHCHAIRCWFFTVENGAKWARSDRGWSDTAVVSRTNTHVRVRTHSSKNCCSSCSTSRQQPVVQYRSLLKVITASGLPPRTLHGASASGKESHHESVDMWRNREGNWWGGGGGGERARKRERERMRETLWCWPMGPLRIT